jgi:hypothetical protein
MSIYDNRHPDFTGLLLEWEKWRLTYCGGDAFIHRYLKHFSHRETVIDFETRREMSYCPAFAKATLNDVKNSIAQKLGDVSRSGGSQSYDDASNGVGTGVDRRGHSMNAFIGSHVLEDLLVCKRVGVYIDMDQLPPNASLIQASGKRPYIYRYRPEDILTWRYDETQPTKLLAVLLQDRSFILDPVTNLVIGIQVSLRHVYFNSQKRVQIDFYPPENKEIQNSDVKPIKTIVLSDKITELPFHIAEISDSLLSDIANYQIAMLNIASSDVSYLTKANHPFYVEQYDPKTEETWIKPEGSSDPQKQKAQKKEITVGVTSGRRFPKGLEFAPQFIHPSSEPLIASMAKQERMVEEIRILINLSLSNIQSKMASADSKKIDSQGLEAGLASIGLELQYLENQIARIWAMYEGTTPATVVYPERWEILSPQEIANQIEQNNELANQCPSMTFRREISKQNARLLLGCKVSRETMTKIENEIDTAKVYTTNINDLNVAVSAGMLDLQNAAQAAGFPDDAVEKAKQDHAERLARIAASQMNAEANPGARGVQDLGADPAAASKERATATDVTTKESTVPPVRGEAK